MWGKIAENVGGGAGKLVFPFGVGELPMWISGKSVQILDIPTKIGHVTLGTNGEEWFPLLVETKPDPPFTMNLLKKGDDIYIVFENHGPPVLTKFEGTILPPPQTPVPNGSDEDVDPEYDVGDLLGDPDQAQSPAQSSQSSASMGFVQLLTSEDNPVHP